MKYSEYTRKHALTHRRTHCTYTCKTHINEIYVENKHTLAHVEHRLTAETRPHLSMGARESAIPHSVASLYTGFSGVAPWMHVAPSSTTASSSRGLTDWIRPPTLGNIWQKEDMTMTRVGVYGPRRSVEQHLRQWLKYTSIHASTAFCQRPQIFPP